MRDYEALDHVSMSVDAVPRTNYRPVGGRSRFVGAQDRWVDDDRLAQLWGDPAAVAAAEADVRAADPELEDSDVDTAVEVLLEAVSERPYSELC
ncbi:hypothetical protein AB4Z54_75930, partial [Streptomyces sp. MCAF7]